MMRIIRAATEAERAGVYFVRIQAMQRAHRIPLSEEIDEKDGPECRYILLLDDIFPAAACRWFPVSADAAEIGRVVVLPEYRGRNLGKAVMQAAEQWIAESGFRKAVVNSRRGVEPFYEKLGYRLCPEHPAHSTTFPCVYMEKVCGKA